MNLLILDPGTMSGMNDDHFIASIEPLLVTPLEKELFKRYMELDSSRELIEILGNADLTDPADLRLFLDRPECPTKGYLDHPIDDALYLAADLTTGEARIVATRLHKALLEFRERLV